MKKKKQLRNIKKTLQTIGLLASLFTILTGVYFIVDRWDKGEIVYDYDIFNSKTQRPDLKKGFVPNIEKEDSYIEYKLTKKRGNYYIDYKSSYFDKLNTGDTIELQEALASYKDNAYKYHYYPFYLDFPILQILIRNNKKTSVTLKTIEVIDIKSKGLKKFHSLPFFSYNQSDIYYYGVPEWFNNNKVMFNGGASVGIVFGGYNDEIVRPKIIFTDRQWENNFKLKSVKVRIAQSKKDLYKSKEYKITKMPIPLDSILIEQGVYLDSMINLIKNNRTIYEYYIYKYYKKDDVVKSHYFRGLKSNLSDSITTPTNFSSFSKKFVSYMGKYSNKSNKKPLNIKGVALVDAQIENKTGQIKNLKQLIDFSYFPTQKYGFGTQHCGYLAPISKVPYIIYLDTYNGKYKRIVKPERIWYTINKDSTSMLTLAFLANTSSEHSFRLKFHYDNGFEEVSDVFHLNYLSHYYLNLIKKRNQKEDTTLNHWLKHRYY